MTARRVFISYSHTDYEWLKRLQIHLRPLEREGLIDLWDDTRIKTGARWRSDIESALSEANAAVLLISADFLASDFIANDELPPLLEAAESRGTLILPIIVGPSRIERTNLAQFQSANPPSRPLIDMPLGEQEKVFADVAAHVEAFASGTNAARWHIPLLKSKDREPSWFDDTVKAATRWFTLLGTYLGSAAALIIGHFMLKEFFPDWSHYLVVGVAAIPLALALLTITMPAWRKRRRDRKLIELGMSGTLRDPGYFRIQPYGSEDHLNFRRLDNAHKTILNWIRTTDSPVLYLTGRSGTGKSSLLRAWVMPELQGGDPPFKTVTVRSYRDPLRELERSLLRPGGMRDGLMKNNLPSDPYVLLKHVCDSLEPTQRLLVTFDQFEEFVILHNADTLHAFKELLNKVVRHSIGNLVLLLVLRSDYIGILDSLDLPLLRQQDNWREVGSFTEVAAADFLDRSGLEIGSQLKVSLLREAIDLEETPGLVRPITLNMFGLVLGRFIGYLPKGFEVGRVLTGYLREALNQPEIRDHAHRIIKQMVVATTGTKQPRSERDLAELTRLEPNLVRGCLLALGNRGLVRPIDEGNRVWEISHDFVARLLNQIVGSWRLSAWRLARPWIAPVGLVLWAGAMFVVFLGAREQPPGIAVPYAQASTEQGWESPTIQNWQYVDTGTAFMPYDWFMSLEQAEGRELFSSPGNLDRIGFLPNVRHADYNPDGLPVGFSRIEIRLDKGAYQCWQGAWVGLTCAACHTGQISYHGQSIRINGGPAHVDIESFRQSLARAVAAISTEPEKAQRFVGRILARQPDLSPAEVQAGLQCFGQVSMAAARFEREALAAADEPPTAAGFARLDFLGRGANFLFAESTAILENFEPTTGPVSFPHLWDTPYFDWVLYNNSARQPLHLIILKALLVGAPFDLSTLDAPTVRTSLRLDNLIEMQLWLQDLKSPKWPVPILGEINQGLVDRGAEIYGSNCAGCHQVIDRAARDARCASRTEFTIPSYPIDAVGTDPRQAVNFASREEITLGQQAQPLGAWLKLVTDRIVGQYTADPKNAARAEQINCDKTNDFQVIEEYRARPLNGIWATAPYLHNGSVPDMVELLNPAAQRPGTFYVGNWEFDPERLGFEWSSPFPNAFLFDTSIVGNSNAGHEHGTRLSEADKRALIEYLKTL